MFSAPIRLAVASLAVAIAILSAEPQSALAASTMTVNTAGDDNSRDDHVSLREAMMLATGELLLGDLTQPECNQVSPAIWGLSDTCTVVFPNQPPGPNSADTIVFNAGSFPIGNPQTINLVDILPTLDTGNDTIDGSGTGEIIVGDPSEFACIAISSDSNTVKGLEIANCNFAITISATPDANENVIGGTTAAERNVIYDSLIGVLLNSTVNGNRIIGNYLGFNPNDANAEGNNWGVTIRTLAHDNIVGGDSPGERNIISGNTEAGVRIANLAENNTVSGNYIGTDPTGTLAMPNATGVHILEGSHSNDIVENLISGNSLRGVEMADAGTTSNIVAGNYIGVDVSGEKPLTTTTGVHLRGGASGNVIGGNSAGERNVIAGGGLTGVLIEGAGTDGNLVLGNYVGTTASGNGLGADIGVNIFNGPANNVIGGSDFGEGNVIAGHRIGALIHTGGTKGNRVEGNYIGTDASGPIGFAERDWY